MSSAFFYCAGVLILDSKIAYCEKTWLTYQLFEFVSQFVFSQLNSWLTARVVFAKVSIAYWIMVSNVLWDAWFQWTIQNVLRSSASPLCVMFLMRNWLCFYTFWLKGIDTWNTIQPIATRNTSLPIRPFFERRRKHRLQIVLKLPLSGAAFSLDWFQD